MEGSGSSSVTNTTTAFGGFQNGYISYAVQSTPTPLGQQDYPKVMSSVGISPILYFKYIKSKFKLLERGKLERRIKEIEKAFDTAIENGQELLAQKFLASITRETREAVIMAKGFKYYIDRNDLHKHKYNLSKGHISDTQYAEYTRHIPTNVVNKKKSLDGILLPLNNEYYVLYFNFPE